jgi:hypothetical protein
VSHRALSAKEALQHLDGLGLVRADTLSIVENATGISVDRAALELALASKRNLHRRCIIPRSPPKADQA